MVAIRKLESRAPRNSVTAKHAFVVFENQHGQVSSVTRHQVKANQTLGLGSPISEKHLVKTMITELQGAHRGPMELLPPNVLVNTHEALIWHAPRHTSVMWIRAGSKTEALRVEWPPLLYVVTKGGTNNMHVFALASNARPTATTRLYHAPLMNIDEFGSVCQGTAPLPKIIDVGSLAECEDTVVRSNFSHINHGNTIKGGANDLEHLDFWKSKAAKGDKPPVRVRASDMAFTGIRLADLLDEVSR